VENGGIQVLFQNSAGANPASHSVGTVDSFHEFKGAEEREQNKTHIAEVSKECYCTATAVTVPLHLLLYRYTCYCTATAEGQLQGIKEKPFV
jgi:hypothetical protein